MTTRDPTDLLEHERVAEEAATAATFKRNQQIDDIKWLMGHASGRRIAARLLEEAGAYRTSFHTSGSVMSFNEGRKHIGYFLMAELLQHTPEAYLKLLKEFSQ